ncbi:AI-2E family transporter [Aestuariivirga sp.]|uniref:AI-2E family transporter n=1 Tax=Aestuariivirga sp. TaxID=2650926 RepID=UPI0039E4B51D
MTLQRQMGFWLAALALFILFLWAFQDILLPFIAGFVLAYFLDPVADWLERRGLNRVLATLIIIIAAVLVVVVVILLVAPILADQALKLAQDLPALLRTLLAKFDAAAPQFIKDMVAKSGTDIQGSVGDIASKAAGWVATLISSVWSGGMAIVNVVSLLVVTPIVAFYLLADWDHIVAKVDGWLPRDHVEEVRAIARDINTAMAGFIRGQGTVCLLLGLFYALGLSLAGLKFGLAIGLGAGLLSFIPYIGALTGGVMAIGVGLVQFWPEWSSVAIIIAIFAAGQFIEGNFLSPKLVGGSIGLHPVWLMFALFAFGYVFGFVGLLLAVPMAAAAGVLVRYGLSRYLSSRLYTGTGQGAGQGALPQPVPTPVKTPVATPVKTPARRRT